MASDVQWFERSLGEVTVNHDGKRRPVKESERKGGPYPYYGASGIVDYVDGYIFEGLHLLIAEDGENLRTRQTPIAFMADGKFWVNNHAHIVTGNSEVTTKYLNYFLQNADIQSYLTGAVMPKLTQGNLNRIPVRYPEPAYQSAIVRVLAALDDKIDLNRRINQTLETMAQAIFKSWFVDFDPVKAKIAAKQEGRDPLRAAMSAISGKPDAELDALPPEQYAQLAATAALFPDEMEESELGEIPKGWKAKKFGDFIDRISVGKKFDQKTALVEGLVPILDQGKSGIIGFHNESPGVRASLEKPIVVFANHTCYMRLITFDFSAIQNVLPFVGKDVDTVWAYYATKDAVKFSEYKGHWPDFVLANAVVPQANLTVHFRKILQPLISQMRSLELESEKLAVLRDTLLPKLLSGELSVAATTAEAEA